MLDFLVCNSKKHSTYYYYHFIIKKNKKQSKNKSIQPEALKQIFANEK